MSGKKSPQKLRLLLPRCVHLCKENNRCCCRCLPRLLLPCGQPDRGFNHNAITEATSTTRPITAVYKQPTARGNIKLKTVTRPTSSLHSTPNSISLTDSR